MCSKNVEFLCSTCETQTITPLYHHLFHFLRIWHLALETKNLNVGIFFAEYGGDPTQFDAATGGGGPGAGWRSSSRGGGIHHGSIDGGNNGERFSRKVFVGGLPPDIDEGECHTATLKNAPITCFISQMK